MKEAIAKRKTGVAGIAEAPDAMAKSTGAYIIHGKSTNFVCDLTVAVHCPIDAAHVNLGCARTFSGKNGKGNSEASGVQLGEGDGRDVAKKKTSRRAKAKCGVEISDTDGKRKPRAARAPRKATKKSSAKTGKNEPFSFPTEWHSLLGGPYSLSPGPASWMPLSAEGPEDAKPFSGPNNAESILPETLRQHRDNALERDAHALMHPPRQFAYDAGSLMAYQGCQWDAASFADMELSALPWLASTRDDNSKRVTYCWVSQLRALLTSSIASCGYTGSAKQELMNDCAGELLDFSLPAGDPAWTSYIQLLGQAPANPWAPLERDVQGA